MKTCTKCKESKDESEFYKSTSGKDGLRSRCKVCCNRESSKWRELHQDTIKEDWKDYYHSHKNKLNERSRKWHHDHKDVANLRARNRYREHLEQARAYSHKWREDHPDESKATTQKWMKEHPERVKANRQRWADEHPDTIRDSQRRYSHNRRAKLANSPFPKDFKLASCCWVCLSTEKLTVDHIVPISRGGTNDISNLTTLCQSCNSSKNNRLYSEWLAEPDFLTVGRDVS